MFPHFHFFWCKVTAYILTWSVNGDGPIVDGVDVDFGTTRGISAKTFVPCRCLEIVQFSLINLRINPVNLNNHAIVTWKVLCCSLSIRGEFGIWRQVQWKLHAVFWNWHSIWDFRTINHAYKQNVYRQINANANK